MHQNEEKLLIGITGGIGSGKTTFAKILTEQGFCVISTDELAKNVISSDSNVKSIITHHFGAHAFLNGEYNSPYIAAIVFNDSNKLNQLNQIILPRVINKLVETIDSMQTSEHKLIFVESALLFEFELEGGFDYVISVSAKQEIRKERLLKYRELTEDDVKKRIKKQITQEEKDKYADFVVENNGDIADLKRSVENLIPILLMLPNRDLEEESIDNNF